MKRIHSIAGGKWRIWWVTHRRDAIHAACLVAIVVAFGLVGRMDYEDRLAEQTRLCAAASAEAAAARAYADAASPVAFVLEARTPRELSMRLAEIASSLDAARSDLRDFPKKGTK